MIRTKHFRLVVPEAQLRRIDIPGFTGPVWKELSGDLPLIEQTGYADSDAATIAELQRDKGKVNVLYTIPTGVQGTYTQCFKLDVQTEAEQTANGTGIIRYTIRWQQITATVT